MGIINRWVLETAIGGTPLDLAGTFVGEIGAALLRGSQSTDPSPDVVLDWAIVKVGAAQVGVPLLEHLRKQPGTLATMLTPIPDLIEVVALTLVATSVLGAFDLCADALYRASGGVPEPRGQYKDLSYWRNPDRRAERLKLPASRQWLDNLLTSPELSRIVDTRHALVHRHIGRKVTKALLSVDDGQGGRKIEERFIPSRVFMSQGPGKAPKDLGSVDDLVSEAAAFGEREVLACRDAMRSDGTVSA